MTDETIKNEQDRLHIEWSTDQKEVSEYFFSRFVSSLNKEKARKSVLVNELDSITEGKEIVLSNAR